MALHLSPRSEQQENVQTRSAALDGEAPSRRLPHLYGLQDENRWSKAKGLGLNPEL